MAMRITRRNILLLGTGLVSVAGLGAFLAPAFEDRAGAAPRANTSGYPFLKGISFIGMEAGPGEQWPVKWAVQYYVQQKKMNLIRLPLGWELMQPELGKPLAPDQIVGITDQIERATKAGAYIILGLHNFGRREVGGKPYVVGETPVVTAEHFSDLWGRIAAQWKDHPKVIYALMNEPHDQDDDVLVKVSNAAIHAIRATGSRQLILVNGNEWGVYGWRSGASNYTKMLQIVDSANNFAFDVHQYFDKYSAGQSTTCLTDSWQATIHRFTDWAREKGKRAFCGEFAVGANAICADQLSPFLTYLENNQDVWMGWAWWGGGGWWQQNYIFRLDPYANPYDKDNPNPAAAQFWEPPLIDRPQMAFLQPFLPAEAAPFNGATVRVGPG